MRKTIFLLFVILGLCAVLSAGWFYVVSQVEKGIETAKQNLFEEDRVFQCADQKIQGFPFRISVACDTASYSDNRNGLVLQLQSLKTAAQLYQPGKIVAELGAPAQFQRAGLDPFAIDWQSMRASVSADFDGVEQISVLGRDLILKPQSRPQDSATLSELQIHSRKFGENDLDLVVRSDEVTSIRNLWPQFDFGLDLSFSGIYNAFLRRPNLEEIAKTQGLTGKINSLRYEPQLGGELQLSGPIEVSRAGRISGKFEMRASDLRKLVDALEAGLPQHRKAFEQARTAIEIIAGVTGSDALTIPLTVRNGKAAIGFIPIGDVPPLF